jgi:hypothetical protein
MKKAVVPLAILAMIGLLVGAVALDCVRMAADARGPVTLADQEVQKHELRLVKLLIGSPRLSPEVQSAITAYQGADGPRERHDAYEQLVTRFRQSMFSVVDPTNPLDRKFMDDIAGAINRREIAQKPYDDELAVYQQFLNCPRGRVARWFSPQARADWKPVD